MSPTIGTGPAWYAAFDILRGMGTAATEKLVASRAGQAFLKAYAKVYDSKYNKAIFGEKTAVRVPGVRATSAGGESGKVLSQAEREVSAQLKLTEIAGDIKDSHYLGRHSPLVSDKALKDRAVSGIDPWTGKVQKTKNGKILLRGCS